MSAELRYRAEITRELASRAEPQLVAALEWWHDCWTEAVRRRRRIPIGALRWLGLSLSLAGIGLTGYLIVVLPDAPCYRGTSALVFDAVMPVFVVLATLFAFMHRVQPALEAWARRVEARRGRRMAERARRAAPYVVDYVLSGGTLTALVEKPRVKTATALRRVESAAFAADLACLFGGRLPRLVKRIVWLPDAAARDGLREALRAAGASLAELPHGAGAPTTGAVRAGGAERV